VERRDFLTDVARVAALCAVVPNAWRVTSRPRLVDDPFQLGVACGDPTSAGGVLWTRLAPRPLELEGGMDGQKVTVNWEVADDDRFARVVRKGRATAALELSYSVHVDVDGLSPDRWYFYRFTVGDAVSPVGRLRTAPAAGAVGACRNTRSAGKRCRSAASCRASVGDVSAPITSPTPFPPDCSIPARNSAIAAANSVHALGSLPRSTTRDRVGS
jgi:phosphodiesterase/alkaline phosphatase D-like protein